MLGNTNNTTAIRTATFRITSKPYRRCAALPWQWLACWLLLLCLPQFASTQSIQDCIGAIPVCQDIYSEVNAPSSGSGNVTDVLSGETCMDTEENSAWYVFTASEAGMLGFIITPANLDDDYDWALFDITTGDCDDVGASTLVSCNAAGGLGCHGQTGCTSSGIGNSTFGGCGGTGPFNALVPMQEGSIYALLITNWTGSNDGYEIDFSESTGLGIFDETLPEVESVENLPQSCGDNTIEISFTEFLQCNSVNNAAFQLTGPSGPYAISVSSPDCNAQSNQARSFTLTINPPIASMGDYTLAIATTQASDLLDLCDNQTPDFVFPFTVDTPIPSVIDIGQDTSLVCDGDDLILDVSSSGTNFLWEDGSTDPTLLVNTAGIYSVTVTDECGVGSDAVEVFVQQLPPTVNFGADQLLCPSNDVLLDADNGIAFYTWQDGSSSPTYLVDETGDYSVTVTNGCGTVEDAINITYIPPLNLNLATEYVLCLGDTLSIELERPFASYIWGDGNTQAQRIFTTDGTHTVTVTTQCEEYSTSFDAIFLVDPTIELGDDSVLCPGDSLLLSPGIPGANYLWQDGSGDSELLVTAPGMYSVTVSTACNDLVDEVFIDYLLPITTDLGRDTFLCPEDPFSLDATTAVTAKYQWEDGSIEAERLIIGPGEFMVTVTSDCETVVDTLRIDECEICSIYMPNIFSPNDDGINDRFFPQSHCGIEDFELQIFDRWGQLVYISADPGKGWDGKVKGQNGDHGVYVWFMSYTVFENGYPHQRKQSGEVAIIR
ncbi:MAG: gliding motility-associated C-terminal domain-containing protein [Bacteroidota bacterium]